MTKNIKNMNSINNIILELQDRSNSNKDEIRNIIQNTYSNKTPDESANLLNVILSFLESHSGEENDHFNYLTSLFNKSEKFSIANDIFSVLGEAFFVSQVSQKVGGCIDYFVNKCNIGCLGSDSGSHTDDY